MSEENKKENNQSYRNLILMICALVAVGMIFVQRFRQGSEDACQVIPQSAWGQGQQQAWVELDSAAQNKGIAGFDLVIPESEAVEYDHATYRAYSYQVNEVVFVDADNQPVMRVDKGKNCGQDILNTNDSAYSNIQKLEIDGKNVTQRGDSDSFRAVSWVSGEYSYGIVMYQIGLSAEDVVFYVTGIE